MAHTKGAMYVASTVSVIDRSSMPPMLIVIAVSIGSTLSEVAGTLAVNALAYALAQIAWSRISDRYGRIRVIVSSMMIGSIGAILAALAWNLMVLGIARGITGAAFAAIVPAALTYFGDNLNQRERVSAIANLTSAISLGVAGGTFGAAFIAEVWDWRVVFLATGLASIVVGLFLSGVPESRPVLAGTMLGSIGLVFTSKWSLPILMLTFVEGFSLVGIMGFLPVSLQAKGESVILAGVVTAAYGVCVLTFGQLTKLVAGRLPPAFMILAAGVAGVASYATVSVTITPLAVLVSASLLGFAWAFGHTTMQAWMTDAVAASRATGVSLFAMSLFLGAGAGAAVGAFVIDIAGFQALFITATIVAAVFAIGATVARSRYQFTED